MPAFDSPAAEFLASKLAQEVLDAIVVAPIQSLGAGPRSGQLAKILETQQPRTSAPDQLSANSMLALESALWLAAGDLDRSHSISQNLATAAGSFWHGVMHRREGDFSNAKYWFHKCGKLDFFDKLAAAVDHDPLAGQLSVGSTWNPDHFVNQSQRASRGGELEQQCQRAQWLEWQFAVVSLF